MARPAKPQWNESRKAWVSAVGEVSPRNGRRMPVAFRVGRDGRPLTRRDAVRARQVLDDYLEQRDAQVITDGAWTLVQLCTLYLAHSERTAARNTFRGHQKVLRLVCRRFGALETRAFTSTHLDALVREWAAAGRKPTYIARMVASVQAVLNWSAAPVPGRDPERLIPANPVKGYRSEHCAIPDAPDRYADASEVEAFLAWGRQRARSIGGLAGRFERLTVELVAALALTGARPGELCAATWADFEPRAAQDERGRWWGRIAFDPTRHKTGRKTGKARVILCPPRLVRTIRAIGRLNGHHPEFLWTHRRGARAASRGAIEPTHGEPWNSNALSRRIKRLRGLAIAEGVPVLDEGDNRFVAYRLRHTAAATLLMNGQDVYTVGKVLGTSAQLIQRTYGSALISKLIEAAAGMERKPGKLPGAAG